MNVPLISEMVRLFQEGVERYQPVYPGVELEEETGDPGVSTRNLTKLLEGDILVNHIMLLPKDGGKCRSLILLGPGIEYLALGFGLRDPAKREALTRFAVTIGYGEYTRLKRFYDAIPDDYDGMLPSVTTEHPAIFHPTGR